MIIEIEHIPGTRPQFNVSLHSKEGKDAFLTIRGCRIMDGTKGPFVSWPATKNEKTGKYWNHMVTSKEFSNAVLAKAEESAPPKRQTPDNAAEAPF
jgi:DNA-binding cell septation regulator SpoVG